MFGWLAKAFGRWGDDTKRIARQMKQYLDAGETVIAAVYLQRPGTTNASVQGGAAGATTGAVGADTGIYSSAPFRRRDPHIDRWVDETGAMGVEPQVARRAIKLALAVTKSRLVLAYRSYVTGRVQGVLVAWPLERVEAVVVPRRERSLTITADNADLRCELPNEHRFIADVYRDLPKIVEMARTRG